MFRNATPADIPAITRLINLSYRGAASDRAWTHEGSLFAENRTSEAEVEAMLSTPGSRFLLGFEGDALVCSTLLKLGGDNAYLGLLAVEPSLQGGGIGRRVLEECERLAREAGLRRMTMMVISSHRPELVAYYQRRGYRLTGRLGEFSRPAVRELAARSGMRLEWMEKAL